MPATLCGFNMGWKQYFIILYAHGRSHSLTTWIVVFRSICHPTNAGQALISTLQSTIIYIRVSPGYRWARPVPRAHLSHGPKNKIFICKNTIFSIYFFKKQLFYLIKGPKKNSPTTHLFQGSALIYIQVYVYVCAGSILG